MNTVLLTKLFFSAVLLVTPTMLLGQSVPPAISIHEVFLQDQKDQEIDNEKLPPAEQHNLRARYDAREAEVKRLMQTGAVHSPQDFFDAGVVLTHSLKPENQLLAHMAFTAAAFEGNLEAKHLAATSLDRYLALSHQTPFFGTSFQAPYQGWRHVVSPDMNDAIRSAFCVPSLPDLNKLYELEKSGRFPPDTGHDEYWDTTLKGCK